MLLQLYQEMDEMLKSHRHLSMNVDAQLAVLQGIKLVMKLILKIFIHIAEVDLVFFVIKDLLQTE